MPTIGEWHHIAGTYDGSSIVKIFVDGTEAGSVACTQAIQANSEPIYIGGGVSRSYWFDGKIDEVRISSVARTEFPFDYFASGTLESKLFDGGATRDWFKLEWDQSLPAGTDITIDVNRSNDGTNFLGWEATSSASPIDLTGLDGSQYIKWRATLTNSDNATPELYEVRVLHFTP